MRVPYSRTYGIQVFRTTVRQCDNGGFDALDPWPDMPDEAQSQPHSLQRPQLPVTDVVTVRETPDDDPRRERPTPEGDALSPTRYGDWEQNGHCIDF